MGLAGVIDAIVLRKTLQQEKHCILEVFTRQGARLSLLAYGGQNSKGLKNALDCGSCYQFEVSSNRTKELLPCRKWNLKWRGENSRTNYRLFYVQTFFLEIYLALVPHSGIVEDLSETKDLPLFSVLSNSLFYLSSSRNLFDHLCIFLIKLCHSMGISPSVEQLEEVSQKKIFEVLNTSYQISFANGQAQTDLFEENDFFHLFRYLCYHQHLAPEKIRSRELLTSSRMKML